MSQSDVLAQVISVLDESLPDVTVGDTLPPTTEMDKRLPCVVVDLLPGSTRSTAWGGVEFPVLEDEVVLDVEVFAASRGRAFPVAEQVRRVLYQVPHVAECDVTTVDCPVLASREDLNPRVKVLGAEAVLTTHA